MSAHFSRIGWLLLLGILASGCSTSGPGSLVTYELSGGIAGYATLVTVLKDGSTTVQDRVKTGALTMPSDALAELRKVCESLLDSGAEMKALEEPECCDLILEQVTYKGRIYPLADLDPDLAESLRENFQSLLEQGLLQSVEEQGAREAGDE